MFKIKMHKKYVKNIFLGIFLGICSVIVYLYMYNTTVETEPYRSVEKFLLTSQVVQDVVGKQSAMSINIFTGYNIELSSDAAVAKAELKVKLSGDKGKGVAIVQAEKKNRKWFIISAFLHMNGRGIDIAIPATKTEER